MAFDRRARSLQQRVFEAVCAAAKGTRDPFASAPEAADKSSRLIIRRASGKIGSSGRDASLLRTASRDASVDTSFSCTRLTDLPSNASTPNLARRMNLGFHCGVVSIVTLVIM